MPARIRRILIGRGNEGKDVVVQVICCLPGRNVVWETRRGVPAPSLIWVHGQQSGDMMMDGVPGVRAVKGVRPLILSGTLAPRSDDRRLSGAGRGHQWNRAEARTSGHAIRPLVAAVE